MIKVRDADLVDKAELLSAIERWLQKTPAVHMKHLQLDAVSRSLDERIATHGFTMVGDFAVLWDYGSNWYSDSLWLFEDAVIRVSRDYGNSVDEAVSFLQLKAHELGCVGVVSGDTQVGTMTAVYKRNGFTDIGSQMYKECNG
jgi:hypothetical protein